MLRAGASALHAVVLPAPPLRSTTSSFGYREKPVNRLTVEAFYPLLDFLRQWNVDSGSSSHFFPGQTIALGQLLTKWGQRRHFVPQAF